VVDPVPVDPAPPVPPAHGQLQVPVWVESLGVVPVWSPVPPVVVWPIAAGIHAARLSAPTIAILLIHASIIPLPSSRVSGNVGMERPGSELRPRPPTAGRRQARRAAIRSRRGEKQLSA
jgi:hypothetical protein